MANDNIRDIIEPGAKKAPRLVANLVYVFAQIDKLRGKPWPKLAPLREDGHNDK